jgi:hypothetical protein
MADDEYVKFFYECRDAGDVTRARGFRPAWLDAFVGRIAERFKEERARAVAANPSPVDAPGTGPSTALLRLDQSLVKVRAYIDEKFQRKARYSSALNGGRSSHAEGRARGRSAADRMQLGRRGVEPAKGPRGLLS